MTIDVADRPVLVLLNSIGTDLSLWDRTVPLLLPAFRLLRIDTRGAGGSDAPEGDYTLALLAGDVAAVMDDAGVAQAVVAGVSLGGMVAMQLALDHPDRVAALALICTSATMDPAAWNTRIDMVRQQGTAAIADMAVGRFLSPDFAARHPEIADSLRDGIVRQSDAGYAGAGAAIRDMALAERLSAIAVPTLVVTAMLDVSAGGDQRTDAARNSGGSGSWAIDAGAPPLPSARRQPERLFRLEGSPCQWAPA